MKKSILKNKDLSQLADQTQLVYERNASQFERDRPKRLIEKPWLDRFLKLMPRQSSILDLGCGSGEPIATYLMELGHRVVGLDASENMIGMAKKRCPSGDWRMGDMRSFDMGESFHGIIGWNSFFHLTRVEQRFVLPNMAKHLKAKGALLLTVGPVEGEVAGIVGNDPVYHASLSQIEYTKILAQNYIEIKSFSVEDENCYNMTILLAQKIVFASI